jgi:hypothetical protein
MNRVKLFLFTAIFVASAFLNSCGQHDPLMSSFADGSGEDDPSSSSSGDEVLGGVLGSCMGIDHGYKACVEILNSNDNLNLSVARETCIQNNGAWSTGSACPEFYVDVDYPIDGGGAIYYYSNPVQLPDDAVLLAAGELMEGSIAELNGEAWYKFAAIAGVSYNFWWDDVLSGNSSGDMADVVVDVYNGDGELIFRGDDEDNSLYPGIIALESGDWVYVRIVRISREGGLKVSVVYNGGEMPSSSSYEDGSSSSMISDEEEEDDE